MRWPRVEFHKKRIIRNMEGLDSQVSAVRISNARQRERIGFAES
jgi:hypothetical protein